ncbi:MAG: nucleoside hydrolase [Actinomycetes bacterium]
MVPVLLDVDTGVDDALAILLAVRHPGCQVLGITCVAGNTDVDQVVTNTLLVLDAAGAGQLPVARGAERPLIEPPPTPRHVHGEDGMGDLGLPVTHRHPVGGTALELAARLLTEAREPVTLVPTAPLTNIALLVRAYPRLVAEKVARIVLMGGSAGGGNASPVAEFNVWHDPEAAAIVLGAGVPVTMYGLDVFYAPTLDGADATTLMDAGDPGASLAGRLVRHQMARFGRTGATLGDAGAVAAVLDPAGVRTERRPVTVELAGASTRGQTVVDRRTWAGDMDHDPPHQVGMRPVPVDVALEVDADRYRRLFLHALLGGAPLGGALPGDAPLGGVAAPGCAAP